MVAAGCEAQVALSRGDGATAEEHLDLEEARKQLAERPHPFFPGLLKEEESIDGKKRKERGRGRPTRGVAENDVPEFCLTAHRPFHCRQEALVHHGVAGPDERLPLAHVAPRDGMEQGIGIRLGAGQRAAPARSSRHADEVLEKGWKPFKHGWTQVRPTPIESCADCAARNNWRDRRGRTPPAKDDCSDKLFSPQAIQHRLEQRRQ